MFVLQDKGKKNYVDEEIKWLRSLMFRNQLLPVEELIIGDQLIFIIPRKSLLELFVNKGFFYDTFALG